ncbi:MAG: ABC transporter substrate-binding protein [Acidobacteria bacterium]|nr:ABC transporter substrate-binding protein [Acidobacteriota bacterium]
MDRRQILQLGATALASSCAQPGALTVGAKNFTEQDILGEVLTAHLARQLNLTPKQRLHLGGSFLAHQALIDGGIDLYPEYSGTALTACLKLPLVKDPRAVFNAVKQTYAERHQIEWGWPLGFENTFAMVMRTADATALKIRTLSDAVRLKQDWRLGVGYEFEQRPDGWRSFVATYPLQRNGNLRTMDLGLLYRALDANDVDLVAGNSTDPALSNPKFTALIDDLRFFPPYETCLAVRQQTLARLPALGPALDKLAGRISVALMRNWNAQVVLERKSPAAIAAAFVAAL